MIKLENVSKFYYSKGVIAVGFSRVNLSFDKGEFVAITGESGSGKSTLLNVISGLDTYEEGEMYIDGKETSHYTEKDFEDYRRKYIGNIFQSFNLVNSYTVYQNIELVMLLNGSKGKDIKKRVNELIDRVGLSEYKHTKASKLSGGQKQRVAIARALAKDTPIIIADEPTGNLDSESAADIIKLLSEIAKDKLVIIVTHNYDQVQPYITRKIRMHDGKVLEDEVIKNADSEVSSEPLKANEYKNIRPLSQVRLGVRNSFNIPMKFLLLTFVFLFISVAMVSELALFKSEQHNTSLMGWNQFFNNTSENRIVIRREDGKGIKDEEFDAIKKIENVDFIEKNDLVVDSNVSLDCKDEELGIYLYGLAMSINRFEGELDIGRMPEKDNEVVLLAEKDSYVFNGPAEDVLDIPFNMYTYTGLDQSTEYKVVGIRFAVTEAEKRLLGNEGCTIYVSEKTLDDIILQTNLYNSSLSVVFNEKTYNASDMSGSSPYADLYPLFYVQPSDAVEPGTAVVSTQLNTLVKDGKSVGKYIDLNTTNPYYKDSIKLKISKTYNKRSYKKYYTGDETFEYMDGYVFVNREDFRSLFNKGTFQSSVFVKDPLAIEGTLNKLNEMGYKTLAMKDALYKDSSLAIIKLVSYFVTAALAIALFFISYFVIRIILKSRNVYYSTIRMLGANVGVSRNLLIIDLLTDANLAYLLTLGGLKLLSHYLPDNFLSTATSQFMGVNDFVIIYLIVVVISLMISLRYSQKLFKNSTMETIKEEV